ncbi:BrnA antitoxin family protein [Tardiphaga sp. 862_B3_N4_1]|jgi:uncharacterized protein (DUF4415 family)|uniref:BrnA antitoxin family protein n=1 Tax=Tardiphaga sp. 862_B3_N4_1 TaxID=3240764 RepID=UPI003F21CD24
MSAKKRTPPATHDDNPEWTAADFAASRPAEELPPDILAQFKNKPGRPRVENPKVPVKIRLDDDVVTALRATGPGWQTRINDMLKSRIKRGKIEFALFSEKPKPRAAAGAAKRKRA